MKRNKSIFFLSIIAALGLAGCSLQDVKQFAKNNIVGPARALIEKIIGKQEQQEEQKDEEKPSGEQEGGEQGGEGQGGEGEGGQPIGGRNVRVNEARPKEDRPRGPRRF